MPDTLAVNAYRNDIASTARDVQRAVDNLHRHLTAVAEWLDGGSVPPSIHNFGTDTADLVASVARLKALHDLAYLAEDVR